MTSSGNDFDFVSITATCCFVRRLNRAQDCLTLQYNGEKGKKWSSFEGGPLVPENFKWICALHLHFNRFEPKSLAKWKASLVTSDRPKQRARILPRAATHTDVTNEQNNKDSHHCIWTHWHEEEEAFSIMWQKSYSYHSSLFMLPRRFLSVFCGALSFVLCKNCALWYCTHFMAFVNNARETRNYDW